MTGKDWLATAGLMAMGFFFAIVFLSFALIMAHGGWILLIIGLPLLLLQIIVGGVFQWVLEKTVLRKVIERENNRTQEPPRDVPWLREKSVWIGAALACTFILVQNIRIWFFGF